MWRVKTYKLDGDGDATEYDFDMEFIESFIESRVFELGSLWIME